MIKFENWFLLINYKGLNTLIKRILNIKRFFYLFEPSYLEYIDRYL